MYEYKTEVVVSSQVQKLGMGTQVRDIKVLRGGLRLLATYVIQISVNSGSHWTPLKSSSADPVFCYCIYVMCMRNLMMHVLLHGRRVACKCKSSHCSSHVC